jgi:hypothetical protein
MARRKVVKPTKAEQKVIDRRMKRYEPKKETLYERVKSGKATAGKPTGRYYKKSK